MKQDILDQIQAIYRKHKGNPKRINEELNAIPVNMECVNQCLSQFISPDDTTDTFIPDEGIDLIIPRRKHKNRLRQV